MIQTHPQQYGIPWLANSLSNTQIGGNGAPNRVISVYFRAPVSRTLTGVVFYVKTGAGYSAGTGGTTKVELQSDDGTANHFPSGSVLATKSIATGTTEQLMTWTFTSSYDLVAGTLYHLVCSNTDASPTVNFISFDDFDMTSGAIAKQRGSRPSDLGTLINDNGAGWGLGIHYPGCFNLVYADGSQDGLGFIDAPFGSGVRDIGGANNAIRLNFTPVQDRIVNRVNWAAYKQATSSVPVDLELYAAGTKIAATQVPSSAFVQTQPDWVGGGFGYDVPLQKSVNYTLEAWSRTETVNYKAYPVECGGNGGFGALFVSPFPDGYWEYTTTGTGGWTKHTGSTDYKPMMYFEMVGAQTRGGRRGTVYA